MLVFVRSKEQAAPVRGSMKNPPVMKQAGSSEAKKISLFRGRVYLTGAKVTTTLSDRVTILTGVKLTPA